MECVILLVQCQESTIAVRFVRALFCGFDPQEKRMAVFVAFSDESDVGNAQGEFFMGGYVADEKEWPWVVKAWVERVLDGPPRIPYLHMTEIRREEWRADHSISYNQAEERISEAVRVIFSSGAVSAVGSYMRRDELKDTIHKSLHAAGTRPPIGLDQPDYLCFIAYAAHCLDHVLRHYQDVDRVDFVVSRKNKVTNHISTFHEELKRWVSSKQPGLSNLVGHLIPGDMEDHKPLQMADLFCWHIQRYHARTMNRTDESRLWYLAQAPGKLHESTRTDLEHLAARFSQIARS